MKHYIAIGVDYQTDFVEGGSLAVEGGNEASKKFIDLLNYEADGKHLVGECILTKDSHPHNHCSFKPSGIWPWHCVADTVGAAIVDPIIPTLAKNDIPYGVVAKGQNKDEENYTAFRFVFKNKDLYSYSMAPDFDPAGNLLEFLRDPEYDDEKFDEIIISGIAGDYCVLETIKAMIDMDPIVYLPGVASIDGGKALSEYIKDKNLRVMDENFNITRGISKGS